ncbi:hypothetical protein O3M35_010152 [Rhynocoris fuscipes]|uniref:Uncharacterized protein n=1 Tax=Rhynocoris fuscipes TaxID=488301 RepID=A0AAW1CZ64_9HEMI
MYEMWTSVGSNLDSDQESESTRNSQQPHTSSGSIKASWYSFKIIFELGGHFTIEPLTAVVNEEKLT